MTQVLRLFKTPPPRPKSENLEILRELTRRLPPVPELEDLIRERAGDAIVYEVENGACLGWPLFWEAGFASGQKAFMSKGSLFPEHAHDEYEHLIVTSGELHIFMAESKTPVILRTGQSFQIEPLARHYCYAADETVMIGITVPPSDGYPR